MRVRTGRFMNRAHTISQAYPTILQDHDLKLEAARIMPGNETTRWRLLLQLDSDDVFMWGTDSGTLYFMIEEEALAAGDFSRVVALTQGL